MVRRGFGTAAALLPFAAAALAAGCAGGHHAHVSKHTAAKPTYAQLVGKNYKVLTPKQTRRFLRYADRVHACLAKRFRLAEPVASTTKIVMRLRTNASIRVVAQAGLECRPPLGPPPLGATLQMRKHVVLVYLPKYCILDRKVARQARLGPSH